MTTRVWTPPLRPARPRRRGDNLVEMSFALLVLLAMVFAITDFGFAIFLKATFQHAAREGVRYAVTYRTEQGLGHDASIKKVVTDHCIGFLKGETGADKVKIRYYNPDTLAEVSQNSPGNIIKVSIEGYEWKWIAPLWRSNTPLMVNVTAADRMEGLPTGTAAPAR